jgi:CRISPR-associated protein Csn2
MHYGACNLEMEIGEGSMAGISFEDPAMFRSFAENLWNQANGADGEIYLTKGDKSVKLQKEGHVIFNPYSIDINDRKILSHIYEEMLEVSEQEYYSSKSEINRSIVALLDALEEKMPYPLEYSLELDFLQMLKLYGVKIEMQGEELMERLVNYIRLLHQVLGMEIFVFVHLMDYFSWEEMDKLEEMIRYEQISVLIVENKIRQEDSVHHKWWIVDRDSCIIEL